MLKYYATQTYGVWR